MQALVFEHQLQLDSDYPMPALRSGQALLKLRKAGICNTDIEITRGYMGFRGIPGHEFVADVVAGDPAWIGKRVVGEINVACGSCDLCTEGATSQCRNRTTVGIDRHDGAFAEYMALTTNNLYEVPANVSDDAAVFVEPLAAAFQVTDMLPIGKGHDVIVIGAGKLGLLVAQALNLTGANVRVITRREKQSRLVAMWGMEPVSRADLPAKRAHYVVDCTGTSDGFTDAIELVRPRGTIVLKSTYVGLPQADLTRVVVDEIKVIGNRCGPFDQALDALQNRRVDVESLIEAQYPITQALEAFQKAQERGALKYLISF